MMPRHLSQFSSRLGQDSVTGLQVRPAGDWRARSGVPAPSRSPNPGGWSWICPATTMAWPGPFARSATGTGVPEAGFLDDIGFDSRREQV